MKRSSSFRSFSILVLSAAVSIFLQIAPVFAGTPKYLHLDGKLGSVGQDRIFTEIQEIFISPLDQLRRLDHISASYTFVVDGESEFRLNIVAEPRDAVGVATLENYRTEREAAGYHGIGVELLGVSRIHEHVELSSERLPGKILGEGAGPGPDVTRDYYFETVADWVTFDTLIGSTFRSRDQSTFLAFLFGFLGSVEAFENYAHDVLTRNNLVMAYLRPTLELDNGSVIGGATGFSPFFEASPYVHDCRKSGAAAAQDARQEMCYPPARTSSNL